MCLGGQCPAMLLLLADTEGRVSRDDDDGGGGAVL